MALIFMVTHSIAAFNLRSVDKELEIVKCEAKEEQAEFSLGLSFSLQMARRALSTSQGCSGYG